MINSIFLEFVFGLIQQMYTVLYTINISIKTNDAVAWYHACDERKETFLLLFPISVDDLISYAFC